MSNKSLMPCKRIERNAFLIKPFKRILTSQNGVLANHSNAVFTRLVPTPATHHIFKHIFLITSYPKWKRPSKIILQNCYTLNQIKPCANLILKSKFFDSKPNLSQGLISAQRKPTFSHMLM